MRPNPSFLSPRLSLLGGTLLFLFPMILFLAFYRNDFRKQKRYKLKLRVPIYIKIFFFGITIWIFLVSSINFVLDYSKFSILNIGETTRFLVYFLILLSGYYSAFFVSKERFLKWVCLGTLLSCCIAFIQLFAVPFLYDFSLQVYGFFKLRTLESSLTSFRVYGTFRNANWFGMFLVIVFPFIFFYYRKSSLLKRCLVYGIVISSIFISGSRSAWIGLALIISTHLIIGLFIKSKDGPRNFKFYFPLIILILISIFLFMKAPIKYKRFIEFERAVSSRSLDSIPGVESRIDNWIKYYNIAKERAILGFGPSQDWIGIPHNGFVLIFVKYGLLGLFFFSFFLGGISLDAIRKNNILGLTLFLSIIAFIYGNIVQDLINTIQVVAISFYLYGFFIAKIRLFRRTATIV